MPGDKAVTDEYPDDLDSVVYGARLKAARRAAGKTQLQMAIAIGCSISAYTSWEQGRHRANRRDQDRIEQITGRSRAYFLGHADE